MNNRSGISHLYAPVKTLVALLVVAAVIALSGCARTFVKEYVEADSSRAHDRLGEYEIEILFRAMKIKDTKGVDDFRLYLIATHDSEIESPDALELFPDIAIDSLCISLPVWDSTNCPELVSIDKLVPGREETVDRGQYRVTYRYRMMTLPADVTQLQIDFIAKLLNRKDGSVELRKAFSHRLSRNERQQIYRY